MTSIARLDLDNTGKIYAVGTTVTGGSTYFYLLNFNSNGTLNTSFSNDGKVLVNFDGLSSFGRTVVLQPNGRVLVAGYTSSIKETSSIARFINLPSLSTSENLLESKFSVSPNPAKDHFIVMDSKKMSSNQKVEILDLLGRILKTVFVTAVNSTINISDLSPGVYLVKINGNTTKLIVK